MSSLYHRFKANQLDVHAYFWCLEVVSYPKIDLPWCDIDEGGLQNGRFINWGPRPRPWLCCQGDCWEFSRLVLDTSGTSRHADPSSRSPPLIALVLVSTGLMGGTHALADVAGKSTELRMGRRSTTGRQTSWQAAIDGDRDRVDAGWRKPPRLMSRPTNHFAGSWTTGMSTKAMRLNYVSNRKQEIRVELPESLDAGDLIEALRLAVEYQTLSDDYDEVLVDPMIVRTIADAKSELPGVIESQDWMHAQEILLRLRTLYEDTSFKDTYSEYDRRMDANGRRMGAASSVCICRVLRSADQARRADRQAADPALQSIAVRSLAEGGRTHRSRDGCRCNGHCAGRACEQLGMDSVVRRRLRAAGGPRATTALKATFPELGDVDSVQAWQDGLDRIEGRGRGPI